jgi:hypothetical protein
MSLLVAGVVVLVTVLVCRSAYLAGCRRTRMVLPREIARELADHKLRCLHEPPERVELELASWRAEDPAIPRVSR